MPLPGFVVDELAAHLAAFPAGLEGLVFQADKGGPILRTTLNGRWRQTLSPGPASTAACTCTTFATGTRAGSTRPVCRSRR